MYIKFEHEKMMYNKHNFLPSFPSSRESVTKNNISLTYVNYESGV